MLPYGGCLRKVRGYFIKPKSFTLIIYFAGLQGRTHHCVTLHPDADYSYILTSFFTMRSFGPVSTM